MERENSPLLLLPVTSKISVHQDSIYVLVRLNLKE